MELPVDERAAIGDRLREHVLTNFDLDRVVDRWLALYREVIERR